MKKIFFITFFITSIFFIRADVNAFSVRHDVNNDGVVNTVDAMFVLRNSLGVSMIGTSWNVSPTTGDANCDNLVDSSDALLLLKKTLDFDMSTTDWCLESVHVENNALTTTNGSDMLVSIYYQDEQVSKPTLYFVAGGALNHHEYEHVINHMVKEGYVVVAASYDGSFNDVNITDNFFEALMEGKNMSESKGINDDARVGLFGHSSGAGALPSLGYKFFVEEGMGSNGRFIFGATPWVDFQFKNNMILPKDTNFVTQWYEDDHGTEPKIYLDMYKYMNVNHKTFATVKKNSDHNTFKTGLPVDITENGIYKPLDALAKYTFKNLNKELIFPDVDIDNKYIKILAENTVPSNADYQVMMNGFINNGSDYPCDATTDGYASNPRLIECQGYRNKSNWYPPQSSFTSMATDTNALYPEYLQSALSNVFENKIVRITDDIELRINHPYPKTPSWNSDGSLLLLTNTLLDGRTYEVIRNDMSWSDGERKWSTTEPTKYYAMQWARNYITHDCQKDNFQFVVRDVTPTLATGAEPIFEVLDGDFQCDLYDEVTIGSYEGNIDRNNKYVVFSVKKVGENEITAILFDIQTKTRVQTKTILDENGVPFKWHVDGDDNDRIFDWITISPLGDSVLLSLAGESESIYQYDLQLNFVRKLAEDANHGDIGIDSNGNQVYVQFGFGDNRGIWAYPLDGTPRVKLLPDKYNGGHISCRNHDRDNWCYLSTTKEGYREVFAFKLDEAGVVERFAQTHTVGTNNSFGGVNANGTKLIFKSTWDGLSNNGRRETFVVEGL